MVESKIDYYEKESPKFNPLRHILSRIQKMENKSDYGLKVASKWSEVVDNSLKDEIYPVIHPIGQETFSLYKEYPTGVFEYALHIDGATTLINEKNIDPTTFHPTKIIDSVDSGNINTDTSKIKTNHKNPVMVIQSHYLTNGEYYCINGNHRIAEAYKNDIPEIDVYIFDDASFVPFFYDFLSRAMYFLEIDYANVMSDDRKLLKRKPAHVFNLFLKW